MLRRLLEILTPGKDDLVVMIEAYFDESETQDDADVLAVSGFIFDNDNCLKLDDEWNQILTEFGESKEKPLPYFRMSSCAHHNSPFEHLSRPECDRAARSCISVIKKYMTYGLSASASQAQFGKWCAEGAIREDITTAAYVWCCWMSLVGVRAWADRVKFNGKIAYFFEAGHRHQTSANAVMNYIFKQSNFRDNYRYGTHAFVPKESNRPVQTADILAWHHTQNVKRMMDGRPRRKDFEEILRGQEDQYRIIHARKELFDGEFAGLSRFSEFINRIRRGDF